MTRIKLILFAVFIFLWHHKSKAQNSIEDQVKSLRLNSSPAFVVLGVDPENIQRPNSPTDFIASVQSALVNEKLQPNFAMETSPYYWSKGKSGAKKFDVHEYLLKNDFWENLARSFTLSFATSPSDSFTFGKIPVGTGLGIGAHMQLFQGHVSPTVSKNLTTWHINNKVEINWEQLIADLETNGKINDMENWLENQINRWNKSLADKGKIPYSADEIENIKLAFKSAFPKNTATPKDLPRIRALRDKTKAVSQNAVEKINEYQFPLTREGFMLELAIANASVAGNNEWNKLQSAKTAIWITPSYRFNINKDPKVIDFIDLMAVARITLNAKNVDTSNYVDAGAKLQWTHNKLSVSGEGIYRYLTNKPATVKKGYTFRTDFTLSYKLNDMVTFTATFGSNFDGNSTHYSDPSKMFAVGGFHFGFSNFLKNKNGGNSGSN
ncbi:MAG: hypothetical protein U0X40_01820 [Ferruginibacter sp.]